MSVDLKVAADELLRIADEIEHDAEVKSIFACSKCDHTISLAEINGVRKQASSEVGSKVTVDAVTVNEHVACTKCEGVLSYQASADSDRYYEEVKNAVADYDDPSESEAPSIAKTPDEEAPKAEELEEGTEADPEGSPAEEKTSEPADTADGRTAADIGTELNIDTNLLQKYL